MGVLAVTLAVSRSSGAQTEASLSLLRHAEQLADQGHDDDARAEFQRAYEMDRTGRAAAELGLAEQRLGRWVDAERHLREALAATSDRFVQRHRDDIQGAYDVNQQHVGRLEVHGEPAGAEVFVNDARVGSLPMSEPIVLLGGNATVTLRAEGYAPEVRPTVITPGQVTREMIQLHTAPAPTSEPHASAPPAARSQSRSSGFQLRAPAVAIAVIGAVLVLAGAGVSIGIASTWATEPTMSDYNTAVPITDTLLAVGAVAIVGGVLFQLLGPNEHRATTGARPSRWTLAAGAHGCSVVAEWRLP
jgi:hypothetical protein